MKIKRSVQGDVVIKLESEEEFAWVYALSNSSIAKAKKGAEALGVNLGDDPYLAQDALLWGLTDVYLGTSNPPSEQIK